MLRRLTRSLQVCATQSSHLQHFGVPARCFSYNVKPTQSFVVWFADKRAVDVAHAQDEGYPSTQKYLPLSKLPSTTIGLNDLMKNIIAQSTGRIPVGLYLPGVQVLQADGTENTKTVEEAASIARTDPECLVKVDARFGEVDNAEAYMDSGASEGREYHVVKQVLLGYIDKVEKLIQDTECQNTSGLEVLDSLREKIELNQVRVLVMALVKAGKSSLINALLHQEYLPVAALPATASITRIVHDLSQPEGVLEQDGGVVVAKGVDGINEAIKKRNDERRKAAGGTLEKLILRVPMPALAKFSSGLCGDIELIDSPGPNEAGAGLKQAVLNEAKMADVVIYVLDVTKTSQDDEADMFRNLADNVLPILQSAQQGTKRAYFVLNKMDELGAEESEPESVEKLLQDVTEKINSYLKDYEGICIKQDQLFPMEARSALYARAVAASSGAEEKPVRNLLHCRRPGYRKDKSFPESEWHKTALQMVPQMVEDSNILKFEAEVVRGIEEGKQRILLESVLAQLSEVLATTSNTLSLRKAASQRDKAGLEEMVKDFEKIQEKVIRAKESLKEPKTEFLRIMQKTTTTYIDGFHSNAKAVISTKIVGKEAQVPVLVAETRMPQLKKAMEDVATRFRRVSEDLDCKFLDGKEPDRKSAEEKLDKLSNTLITELQRAAEGLVVHMMKDVHSQQIDLQEEIRKTLQPLVDEWQQKLSKTLQIDLEPEQINTPTLSHEQFKVIASGMKSGVKNCTRTKYEKGNLEKTVWRTNRNSLFGETWFENFLWTGLGQEEHHIYEWKTKEVPDGCKFNRKATGDALHKSLDTLVKQIKQTTGAIPERVVENQIEQAYDFAQNRIGDVVQELKNVHEKHGAQEGEIGKTDGYMKETDTLRAALKKEGFRRGD